MRASPWWSRAAWASGGVACVLTVAAGATLVQSGMDALALVAGALAGANALLWWLVAAGLRARRGWSVNMGAGAAALNLLLGVAAALGPEAAARALDEHGQQVQEGLLGALFGWAPVAGSALALFYIFMIARRRAAGAPGIPA